MPGESTLPTQYYPDDFQILSFFFQTSAATGNTPDPTMLFWTDRDIIIDQVVVAFTFLEAGGTNARIALEHAVGVGDPSGTQIMSLTANQSQGIDQVTDTIVVTTDQWLQYRNGSLYSTQTTPTAANTTLLSNSQNAVPANRWVCLDFVGTFGSQAAGTIQLRFRSRPK